MEINRFKFFQLVLVSAILLSNSVFAKRSFESKLKIVYLVNIARFTSWSTKKLPKTLCINEKSKIYLEIKGATQFDLGDGTELSIVVNPTDLVNCHILFWDSASEKQDNDNILTTRHSNLLIISDMYNAHEKGFAIQLFVRNLKLRFSIDNDLLKKSQYKISSKLLRLSRQMD